MDFLNDLCKFNACKSDGKELNLYQVTVNNVVSAMKYKQNEIIRKEVLAPSISLFDLYSPHIAKKALPGQFLVIRTDEHGERIPLTIVDHDGESGAVTIIVQVVGVATWKLDALQKGDVIQDVVGPLGNPSHIEKAGTIVCVGGGVGVAPLYPITRAFKKAGNKVLSIIGARSAEMLILEDEMKAVSDELYVCTDDGSKGLHGFVTEQLKILIDENDVDLVMAIGPGVMMSAVADVTRPDKIKTIVSLNTLMVDGTGMCGGCRISYGDETKFVCVDGPEFDAHKVDFKEMLKRSRMYVDQEKAAIKFHKCKLIESNE